MTCLSVRRVAMTCDVTFPSAWVNHVPCRLPRSAGSKDQGYRRTLIQTLPGTKQQHSTCCFFFFFLVSPFPRTNMAARTLVSFPLIQRLCGSLVLIGSGVALCPPKLALFRAMSACSIIVDRQCSVVNILFFIV